MNELAVVVCACCMCVVCVDWFGVAWLCRVPPFCCDCSFDLSFDFFSFESMFSSCGCWRQRFAPGTSEGLPGMLGLG